MFHGLDTRRAGTLFLLAVLPGCASSPRFADTWKDPTFTAPLTHVLVVTASRNATQRRLWEEALTAGLEARGVRGVASHRRLGPGLPDSAAVVEAVRRDGYDGIIVTSRLDPERKETKVPGGFASQPVPVRDPQSGTYYTRFDYEPTEERVEVETIQRHRVEVFTTSDGRLVWTGVGEVVDPASAEQVRTEVTDLLSPRLTRDGILPPVTRATATVN